MNKILIFSLMLTSSSALWAESCEEQLEGETFSTPRDKEVAMDVCLRSQDAQRSQENLRNNSNNRTNNNAPYNDCKQHISRAEKKVPATGSGQYCVSETLCHPSIPTEPQTLMIPLGITPDVKLCRGYEAMSAKLGSPFSATDRKDSQDRKIFCVRTSGITADWDSCISALSMYNSIVVAEAAMQVFQGVQTNRAQGQAQDQYNQRAANGDAQNAAYDAQVATMNSAKQLNQQQAMAYSAAVAALYSKIQSWIKETPEAVIQKGCGKQPTQARPGTTQTQEAVEIYASVEAVSKEKNCEASARHASTSLTGYVFANRDAKAAFTTAAMMFAAKGIMAGIKAHQLGDIAKKVTEAKKQTENPYDAPTFEYCKVNTLDPKCSTPGTVTSGSGLQDGGFGFGEGFGNNAINPLAEEDKLGGVEPLPLPGDSAIPDATNPFTDDAKTASGILDPAGAASVQPGSAGGGGGGGAPGLGGGSASLGNDTPGMDDSKKESDIKANKADGKYNIAGGGAFQAIKPMKEDNPFANLFDGKGGKLEEDRSIASGDIDGQDSGLFSKISKRYGLVQADKRIEAKNLDE